MCMVTTKEDGSFIQICNCKNGGLGETNCS